MINLTVLNPALAIAQRKDVNLRHDVASGGMSNVLQDFIKNSKVWGTNRALDGLSTLDTAVAALARSWPSATVPNWTIVDPLVTDVLKACTAWLDGRKVFGHRATGWRTDAIKNLYWQIAWTYNFKQYAIAAHTAAITNNGTGAVTPVNFGALPAGVINPYSFTGSGYTIEVSPAVPAAGGARGLAAGHVIRGDSRGPLNIANAGGFQGWNINAAGKFAPCFAGQKGEDTISVTIDQGLTINAARTGRQFGGHKPQASDVPAWMLELVNNKITDLKGFVYEVNLGAAANACRLTGTPAGREYIFFAIPAGAIPQWWAIRYDGRTYGPVPFPAPATAPVGASWSASPSVLA